MSIPGTIHRILPLVLFGLLCFAPTTSAQAQQNYGEPLLEVPIHQIPAGMTLEDYEDANRRISMGLFYAITPGGMHFYANEDQTGWVLLGTFVGGFIAVIAGSTTGRDVPQSNTDFETTQLGSNTFYKIPIETTGDNNQDTKYRLRQVETSRKGLTDAGAAVAGIGALAMLGTYVWDIFHGIRVIEKKRSIARYKFGRLNAQATSLPAPAAEIKPMVVPETGSAGLQVEMRF